MHLKMSFIGCSIRGYIPSFSTTASLSGSRSSSGPTVGQPLICTSSKSPSLVTGLKPLSYMNPIIGAGIAR